MLPYELVQMYPREAAAKLQLLEEEVESLKASDQRYFHGKQAKI